MSHPDAERPTVSRPARIGILGGGQLARMCALAGIPLGLTFEILDPTADACAGALGVLRQAAFDDREAAVALVSQGESARDESLDPAKHAAYSYVASLLFNLDETITKE